MRYTQFFGKTLKNISSEEVSINAQLLTRGGFISRELSGVYNFLPLGLRVINKITNIIREEMVNAGGQELLLSSLQNKENWQKTKRWDTFDSLFKVESRFDKEYALGPTHEEVLVPLVKQFVSSYRDLPLLLFQIQNKFRDEERAKSGLLRGREFLMKDLYSFHADEQDFNKYYEKMKNVYKKVFERMGLRALETEASGGSFSDFSNEYQVITNSGEDEIIYCPGGDYSANQEVAKAKEGQECRLGHGPLKKAKAIEVGNIFPLKTRFSEVFQLTYKDKNGQDKPVVMGCYGIGVSRLMGAIVEVHNDDKGIIWPKEVSPFDVHLLHVEDKTTEPWAKKVYEALNKKGINVLWDDRENISGGEKLADADLIGIHTRIVVSKKVGLEKIEIKKRNEKESKIISLEEFKLD